jgi:hypothetical protein
VTLEHAGRYVLTIDQSRELTTGSYKVQVWNIHPPQNFAIRIEDVVGDGQPGPGAGNIESPGAFDVYTFSATPGQRVFLDLQQGAAAGPRWLLTDSAGVSVFDGFLIGDGGTVTLERGGAYTLTIGSAQNDYAGTYQIQIRDVPPPQRFAVQIGDVVSNGQPGPGAGNIESPGALDIYTLSAASGASIVLDLQQGAAAGPRWILTDSTGTAVFSGFMIGDSQPISLEQGGSYTLTIGNEQNDYSGIYQFQIRTSP